MRGGHLSHHSLSHQGCVLAGPPLPFNPVLQSPALPVGSLPSPRSFLLDLHLMLCDFTNSPSQARSLFSGLALTGFGVPHAQ